MIWERFPKFVLGFIAASLVFSFLIPADTGKQVSGILNSLRTVWFALAFVSMGLRQDFLICLKYREADLHWHLSGHRYLIFYGHYYGLIFYSEVFYFRHLISSSKTKKAFSFNMECIQIFTEEPHWYSNSQVLPPPAVRRTPFGEGLKQFCIRNIRKGWVLRSEKLTCIPFFLNGD